MLDKKEYYKLENRSLIEISGKDKFSFIQGIISNDVEILKKKSSIYSAILSPQGRFITDFFLSIFKDSFLIEIQKEDESLLLQKLNMYKLRSEIQIEVKKNINILLISHDSELDLNSFDSNFLCFDDPRFKKLFRRLYFFEKSNELFILKNKLKRITNSAYNSLRLEHSIPDFYFDSIKHKSLLLEMRFDELNGISWTKGCYMGQEITARMKYRNLVKRKLFKIKILFKSKIEEDIKFEDTVIGKITSHNKMNGLAYIDIKLIDQFFDQNLISGDSGIKLANLWWAKD